MSNHRYINVLSLSLIAGAAFGLVKAIHYIVINQYIHYRTFHLIADVLQDSLIHNVTLFAAVVTGLYLFWFLFVKVLKINENKIVLVVMLVVAVHIGSQLLDWLLTSFTRYSLNSVVTQFFVRVGHIFSGDISPRHLITLIGRHIGVVAILVGCLAGLLFLLKKLGGRDLSRFSFDRLARAGAARKWAVLVLALMLVLNVFLIITNHFNGPAGPNLIMICIDALRADHLGHYGYERDTSPFLDELSVESVVFRNVVSQSSWTKTSVAVYMTSNYQMLDRVSRERDTLPFYALTLAEILKDNGYHTGAFVANPWLTKKFCFHQGFDIYQDEIREDQRLVAADIYKHINKVKERPFFLYLHYMDVHNPYDPPQPYARMFVEGEGTDRYENDLMPDMSRADLEHTKALYDGEIRYLDGQLRELFEILEKQGVTKNTIVIIMSDHGDEFLEHGGLGHGTSLYSELLRVPFMFAHHGLLEVENTEITRTVSSVDMIPTILDALTVTLLEEFDGQSRLPLLTGEADPLAPDSTSILSGVVSVATGEQFLSIIKNGYKYIHNFSTKSGELYDFYSDPKDTNDLADFTPDIYSTLEEAVLSCMLDILEGRSGKGTETSLDKETIEKLKSLGYL